MIKRKLAIAVAGLSLLVAAPAFADHWRHDRGWHGHGYGHYRHDYYPYYYGPRVVVVPPAPYYYAPPPAVVYQPPVYIAPRASIVYSRPGFSLGVGF